MRCGCRYRERVRLAPLVAVAVLGWLGLALPAEPVAQPADAVLVVPFANLSRQAADEWIGAGIAETVSSDLRNLGVPVVVDAGSAAHARAGRATNDGQALGAGRVLGARWLVAGGYQRVGDRLRITARLVDATTGEVRRHTTVDGYLADLFDAQDQIVAALADAFPPTRSPAADLVDHGRLPGLAAGRVDSVSDGADPEDVVRAPGGAGPFGGGRGRSGNTAVGGTGVTGVLDLGATEEGMSPAGNGNGPGDGGVDGARQPRRTATVSEPRRGGGFAAAPIARRRVTIGRAAQPPNLDGRLDDAVWETATYIDDFVQIAPVEGAPGTEETEVWMAYDRDNLYFAFHAHYTDPGMIRANRADRDEIGGDDRMSVLFDPFLDQQRAYQFSVNGYGVQSDELVNADGSRGASRSRSPQQSRSSGGGRGGRSGGGGSGLSNSGQFGIRGDRSWNALYETRGRMVEDGWTAEMAIPFKSLRYPALAGEGGRRWGFQITRVIRGKSEAQSWSPISRGVAGQLTQFGILEGLSDLSRSRNLEILPELTGARLGALDTSSGAFDTAHPFGDLGVSVKYGITPNLTADMTYNPDFSQIESDQPQIETNQRFALFYPEQRPFFLEGQEIFQTSTPLTLLHTRTIVDPRFGGKLTGKVGRTTLGVIVADDEAAGRLDDTGDTRFGTTAQTFVGRARYDLYSESYVGAIMTAREFGHDYNRVGGIDGRFRLGRTHRISFMGVGSETQSTEYGFLQGPAFEADFTRQGRNLSYGAAYGSVDPEFWTETGFLPRWNLRQATANVGYRWWPESTLITWGPTVNYLRLYDHVGVLQDEQIQGMASFQFRHNISVTANVNRDLERFEEVDFQKSGYGFYGVISSRLVSVVGGLNRGDGILYSYDGFTSPLTTSPYQRAILGESTTGNFLISGRPSSRWRSDLTGIFSQLVDPNAAFEVIDVKIFRTRTTYQFTDRLLLRYILEHNTFGKTLGSNLLMTYRINAGTVAFLGYDDRYRQGRRIDELLFPTAALQRTNRAVFGKLSYLFRY